jgi:L-lactate dehydrogenase complex protein LldG
LPAVGPTFDDWVRAFQAASADLKTDFRLLAGAGEAAAELVRLRDALGWKRVATHRGALNDPACQRLGGPTVLCEPGYDARELEQCDVGISECAALVAQTGSVVVDSRTCGGRALSVLPPHHVVLARRDQLLPDLPSALALIQRKYAADSPSMISIITGPSRTGDIERILVLGAHGPRQLTILCF